MYIKFIFFFFFFFFFIFFFPFSPSLFLFFPLFVLPPPPPCEIQCRIYTRCGGLECYSAQRMPHFSSARKCN